MSVKKPLVYGANGEVEVLQDGDVFTGSASFESSSAAPLNPVMAQYYFNTAEGQLKIYNGTKWVNAVKNNNALAYSIALG